MKRKDSGLPRIGLLTLMFELYDAIPELEPEMVGFAGEIRDLLSKIGRVEWPGILKTRDSVQKATADFETNKIDIIVVILLTYAPSQIALPALLRANLPIVIFNTQRLHTIAPNMDPKELIRNHGVHGVQDLANVLRRAGREFAILTGHYKDDSTFAELKAWCIAAALAGAIREIRVGALGRPLQGMGDFALDETSLLGSLGVEVVTLSQRELARLAERAPEDAIAAQLSADRKAFEVAPDVTEAEHLESSRLEWAIRETMRKLSVDALAANFMDISRERTLQTLPFLASSKLMAEGHGYAGEGDVLTAVAVALMQKLVGEANFTEMFTMDFGGGAILMSHMGEGNHMMARTDVPIQLVGSELGLAETRLRPVLLRFAMRPGAVTLVNLTTTRLGRLKLIYAEGEVMDFPTIPGVLTPHYKFKPERPLADFLNALAEAGSSHHFAISYGRWAHVVGKTAEILGIEFERI